MVEKSYDNKYCMNEGFCVLEQKVTRSVERHTHNFVEFVYMFSGKCVHTVDGTKYTAQKGDLLFINYNSDHSIKTDSCINYADILIKPEYISDSLKNSENIFSLLDLAGFRDFTDIIDKENCFVTFSGEERKMIEMMIKMLANENKKVSPGTGIVLKSGINMLLAMIFRKMSLPMKELLRVDGNLLLYIKENCNMGITMQKTAQKCGYSTAHFCRLFKEFTGIGFSEYVTTCRIEKACTLLKETDIPVEDVIYSSGFTNRTRFFKIFAEITGTTPKKYRNQK